MWKLLAVPGSIWDYILLKLSKYNVEKFEKEHLQKMGLIKEIEPRYRSTYFLHIAVTDMMQLLLLYMGSMLDMMPSQPFKEKGFLTKQQLNRRKNILAPWEN